MKMAGMAQVLSHRDISHAGDAFLRLNNLRREGILCDLTIIVEGREHKAHKVVMAACSDYFLNAICGGKTTATVTPGDHGCVTVDLEHVTLRGFVPLLEYAYSASLQVNASDVIDVLSAASYMQMFKVASACSEFMRSNIMWAQSLPRLASLPGMRQGLMNGAKHSTQESLSPSPVAARVPSGLPPDMSSLLKATSAMSAAGRAALGQPPLLIPIHSMAYDGIQQLAASMTGTQSILSRATGVPHQALTASAMSRSLSSPRNSSHSPSSAWPTVSSALGSSSHPQGAKESPSPKTNGYGNEGEENYPPRVSSGHIGGSSGRKSMAVKVETRSDDEDSRGSNHEMDENGEQPKSTSPSGSEPVEDSWQALQKLYSIRMTEAQTNRHHPYLPRHDRVMDREGSRSRSPEGCDEDANNNHLAERRGSPLGSDTNSNNNNNSNNGGAPTFAEFISKMVPKSTALAIANQQQDPTGPGSPGSVHPATAAAINGAMQSAILQQQQILAAQQSAGDPNKIVDLPVMPPNGQYMSVRRRTLQSTVPKPHQCQICGSRFTRFHNLKQHIKLHSGIKPYECDECGKRFTRNYTLRLHKMKHVGIRNFRCGTCDASFTSLGEFRAHLRITMHSHVAGAPPLGSRSPIAGNSEPEDLTSSMGQMVGPMQGKYAGYDASMLNFQREMLRGDRASLLSAALGGAMMMRGAGSVGGGSSGGGGSPQTSERSISPEDLSTKQMPSRSRSYEEKLEQDYSPQNAMDTNDAQDIASSEECRGDSSPFCANDSTPTKYQSGDGAGSIHSSSPARYQTDSPESDQEGLGCDDKEDAQPAESTPDAYQDDGNIEDQPNNNGGGNKSNDQPISLVVNASA